MFVIYSNFRKVVFNFTGEFNFNRLWEECDARYLILEEEMSVTDSWIDMIQSWRA